MMEDISFPCSRTLAACLTARWVKECEEMWRNVMGCEGMWRDVKGFLSFMPLAFTRVPPDATTSKLCEDFMFGKSVWYIVFKVNKLANFGHVVGVVYHRNLNLFLRFVKLVSQRKLSVSLSDQSLEVRVLEVSPRRLRWVEVQRGWYEGSGAVLSGYRRKQCRDWGVRLRGKRQFGVNKSVENYKKKTRRLQ
jgi:hypothetical protein